MKNDQPQAERLRVLKMLEEGKINAEECAELLDALSIKKPAQTARQRFQARLMIVAGIVLVMVGFLLPWFSMSNDQLMNYKASQPKLEKLGPAEVLFLEMSHVVPFEKIMQQVMDENEKLMRREIKESQFYLSFPGFSIKYLLGWGILGLGLAAGFISLVLNGLRSAIRRNAALSLLALGAFMILYLVFQAPRFIGLGLVAVILGYGVEAAGVIMRHRQAG